MVEEADTVRSSHFSDSQQRQYSNNNRTVRLRFFRVSRLVAGLAIGLFGVVYGVEAVWCELEGPVVVVAGPSDCRW